MVIAGIPREEILHTRAVQDCLAEGRQEGRLEGEAKVTLRHSTAAAAPQRRHHRPDPALFDINACRVLTSLYRIQRQSFALNLHDTP